jgi:hypothetical protein
LFDFVSKGVKLFVTVFHLNSKPTRLGVGDDRFGFFVFSLDLFYCLLQNMTRPLPLPSPPLLLLLPNRSNNELFHPVPVRHFDKTVKWVINIVDLSLLLRIFRYDRNDKLLNGKNK